LREHRIKSGRKSRRTTIALAGLCLPATALLAAPFAMAGTPSQDQYTFNLPTPHGHKPAAGHAPVSHPNNLSQSQQHAASGPQGHQLMRIATSPELGGQGGHSKIDVSGGSPSAPAAAVDAAGGGPAVALLAAIAGITVVAALGFMVPRTRTVR